jgi:hypothetical protein
MKDAPHYGGARAVSDELGGETYRHYGLEAPATTGIRGRGSAPASESGPGLAPAPYDSS